MIWIPEIQSWLRSLYNTFVTDGKAQNLDNANQPVSSRLQWDDARLGHLDRTISSRLQGNDPRLNNLDAFVSQLGQSIRFTQSGDFTYPVGTQEYSGSVTFSQAVNPDNSFFVTFHRPAGFGSRNSEDGYSSACYTCEVTMKGDGSGLDWISRHPESSNSGLHKVVWDGRCFWTVFELEI